MENRKVTRWGQKLPKFGIRASLLETTKEYGRHKTLVLKYLSVVATHQVRDKTSRSVKRHPEKCDGRISWLRKHVEASQSVTCYSLPSRSWVPIIWVRGGLILDGNYYKEPKIDELIDKVFFSGFKVRKLFTEMYESISIGIFEIHRFWTNILWRKLYCWAGHTQKRKQNLMGRVVQN